ncbi:unnamed protein product [Linum tenue]|uniref:RanBD1 domain-containing protein n=1 Tax=Linum tenue TaxID=586396 RepID=A0AAV0PL37_9ROSI|nr:unnamed protein product [Linum tenue]
MRGTKRLATSSSELAPESNDTGMRTKRAMGSFSDVHKAVTSQKQFKTATPSLDVQRAELSRQHVRALNSQFARSAAGCKNNLTTTLMNFGKMEFMTILLMHPVSCSPSSGLSSESPSSAGGFASVPAPILFGGQSSATTKDNASDDAADGDELPQPGSPSVKKVEEKGVAVVHQVKCKLYVKPKPCFQSIDPADKDTWKDKGPGQLSIKCAEGVSKGTKESSPTLIIRNDLGKVLLNALLYPGIKTSLQKNSVVAIFHVAADDSGSNESVAARTFLIRTKTEDDRDKLATAIREYAPES